MDRQEEDRLEITPTILRYILKEYDEDWYLSVPLDTENFIRHIFNKFRKSSDSNSLNN